MAALINAVVTSCIDSFSSSRPLFLLGLLQEMAAQQESRHLSHEKHDLPSHALLHRVTHFTPDLWWGGLACSVLPRVSP